MRGRPYVTRSAANGQRRAVRLHRRDRLQVHRDFYAVQDEQRNLPSTRDERGSHGRRRYIDGRSLLRIGRHVEALRVRCQRSDADADAHSLARGNREAAREAPAIRRPPPACLWHQPGFMNLNLACVAKLYFCTVLPVSAVTANFTPTPGGTTATRLSSVRWHEL